MTTFGDDPNKQTDNNNNNKKQKNKQEEEEEEEAEAAETNRIRAISSAAILKLISCWPWTRANRREKRII